ncbi:hypothetical protein ACQKIW_29615 [Bacillus thuringiensis]|uniref:hypothetical protein n=1 Tax=Bacillus thuringiensis TaxID=1428 RepID=UPI003D077B7B
MKYNKDYNQKLFTQLNSNLANSTPATINPNEFDMEWLASLKVNPPCIKLTDGQVILQAQLANGSLITTPLENAAIAVNTDNSPTIPLNPYNQWPVSGNVNNSSNDTLGFGLSGVDYVYLQVIYRAPSVTSFIIPGSNPDGSNILFKGYGPLQVFKPDFSLVEPAQVFAPKVKAGDLVCFSGLMVPLNPVTRDIRIFKRTIWKLQPDNSLYNKNVAAQ